MSSPQALFPTSRLKKLKKADRDQLQKELNSYLTPAIRAVIRAHQLAKKELREKLTPSLRRIESTKGKK